MKDLIQQLEMVIHAKSSIEVDLDYIHSFVMEIGFDTLDRELARLLKVKKAEYHYYLALLYIGKKVVNAEDGMARFTPEMAISDQEREQLAIGHAKTAVHLGCDKARRLLTTCLMTGNYGCIQPNLEALQALYDSLITEKNIAANFEYGCYLLGCSVKTGRKLTAEDREKFNIKITLPESKSLALNCLLTVLRSENVPCINKALDLMHQEIDFTNRGITDTKDTMAFLRFVNTYAQQKNLPILALYLMYLQIPREFQQQLPKSIILPTCLQNINVDDIAQNDNEATKENLKKLLSVILESHNYRHHGLKLLALWERMYPDANENRASSTSKF